MIPTLFDAVPLGLVLSGTVLLGLLAAEIAFRVGVFSASRSERERGAPMDAMVGSMLGLLAFVLAFTFGIASARFDARIQLVIEETNAIRAADLRAQLFPEPQRSEIRSLLLEYVDARLLAVAEPSETARALARARELHDQLWSHSEAVREAAPTLVLPYMQALIQMADANTKRAATALIYRIPGVIWITLYSLLTLAMGIAGYRGGIAERRSIVATLTVTLAFAVVITLIADLDRPQQGFLEVNQQTMIDLQTRLRGER
jgi:hypothetical protein